MKKFNSFQLNPLQPRKPPGTRPLRAEFNVTTIRSYRALAVTLYQVRTYAECKGCWRFSMQSASVIIMRRGIRNANRVRARTRYILQSIGRSSTVDRRKR